MTETADAPREKGAENEVDFDVEDDAVEENGADDRGGRSAGPPGRGRGRYRGRRRVCHFCVDKVTYIDYKDVDALRRYITSRGKIRPRRQTGVCSRHQRDLAKAIKRARHLALLPFSTDMSTS